MAKQTYISAMEHSFKLNKFSTKKISYILCFINNLLFN